MSQTHVSSSLFTHANATIQYPLAPAARLDLIVLAFIVQYLDHDGRYACWEDVLFLAGYGLILTCPN